MPELLGKAICTYTKQIGEDTSHSGREKNVEVDKFMYDFQKDVRFSSTVSARELHRVKLSSFSAAQRT